MAGPECGVNPSPGPGRWGNGTASVRRRPDHMIVAELGLGNWWPLFQKAWVLQVTGFPQGISTNFKFRIFFSSMCFKCFKDHSKKSTNTCPFIFSSSIPLSFFFHAGSGGSCWSLENYWKFQAELGGSGGPFAQWLVQSWDGPTVPWVVMDWLRPKMDGWWNSWFPRHRCNVWIWLGDFRFTS